MVALKVEPLKNSEDKKIQNKNMKKIFVICGGTMNHATPHFSLCAPAYGTVGLKVFEELDNAIYNASKEEEYEAILIPTKMALGIISRNNQMLLNYEFYIKQAGLKSIETNEDLDKFIDYLISYQHTRSIVLAAAVCDFKVVAINGDSSVVGKNKARLESSEEYIMTLKTADKVLPKIRQHRKDIFVVSFKTTAGVGRDETYRKGLLSLKKNSSNLVFANDIQDKINLVVTPEEFPYEAEDRDAAIKMLADMTFKRINLTFEDKTIIKNEVRAFPEVLVSEGCIPQNWIDVMQYLFKNNAFKPLPGTGKTSGHFGCRVTGKSYERITSERKINHNESFQRGMIPVYSYKNGELIVGGAKPSVGEKTQELIYQELGDKIHSIVHFHCPLRDDLNTIIPQREQFHVECGSKECAVNTTSGIVKGEIEPGIFVVHLKNHGPNIAFHKDVSTEKVIEVIEKYWNLSDKTGGIIKVAILKNRGARITNEFSEKYIEMLKQKK